MLQNQLQRERADKHCAVGKFLNNVSEKIKVAINLNLKV